MYNVDKGENTFEESEILDSVHYCLRELLELEKQGTPYQGYTDHDVVAVTLLFATVMGNRFVEYLKEQKIGIEASQQISDSYARSIQNIAESMTGVDVKNYFNKEK